MYPSVTQYFAYRQCVKEQTKIERERIAKELEEKLKKVKEDAARPCIASDLARMEALAKRAMVEIKPQFSLEDAQKALRPVLSYDGTILVPDDNIKERVLIYRIPTKCDSSFYFLINLRTAPDGTLRYYRTWAKDAPVGYKGEYHQELSKEFEEDRKGLARLEEKAKLDESLRAAAAKSEEERRNVLRAIKISDARLGCSSSTCTFRTIEFNLTNMSGKPVGAVSIGWMFLTPEMKACPTNLAPNQTFREVLQPGQTSHKAINLYDLSVPADGRFCLSVTSFDLSRPWDR
jgi:hypothetical protein